MSSGLNKEFIQESKENINLKIKLNTSNTNSE